MYKGDRFNMESILDLQTPYKEREQPFNTRSFIRVIHQVLPAGVFIKGEALRLIRTNSSHITFEENTRNVKLRLKNRGYPQNMVERQLSD